MSLPLLYRKRIIPDECIALKDDEILYIDEEIIVTKWSVLKPRSDFHHGYSCYFLNKNIKVSKFMKENGDLHYWYCDIIEYTFDEKANSYTFTDLLADVIIYPDEKVKVVDLDTIRDKDYTLAVNTYIDKKEQEVKSPQVVKEEYFAALQEVRDVEDALMDLLVKGGYVNE